MPAVALAVLALAGVALFHLARESDYRAIEQTLVATPWWRIAAALGLTAVSFLALSFYDLNAFAAIGRPMPWRRIAPGAVAAYAVAQTAGFGPLTGAALRLRFYTALGVSPGDVGRIVVIATASFGVGLVATASLAALASAPTLSALLGVPVAGVLSAAAICVASVTALVLLGGKRVAVPFSAERSVTLPAPGIVLHQLAATALDVLAAGAVLWAFLPAGSIPFEAFLPIYAVALALGVVSHLPAGIGVFDVVILGALGRSLPPAEVLAALALYRIVYHGLPLLLASLGIVATEIHRIGADPATRRAASVLAPQMISGLSLLLGAMLVFSGVTPARVGDLLWLAGWVPLPILEGAHFLASVLGAVLMISAQGLAYRLDGAWWAAVLATAAALVLSVVKALAIYEAAALAVLLFALLTARPGFRRPALLTGPMLTPAWIGAVAAVLVSAALILLFVYDHIELTRASWFTFEAAGEGPRSLRALVATSLVVLLVALRSLLRARTKAPSTNLEDIARAQAIAAAQPAVGASLVRAGDKQVMLSDDGRAFLMYGRHGRTWLALFDPVGPRDAWPGLVWKFLEKARQAGGRGAVYEVSPDALAVYADAGMSLHKLGEEARVDLAAFDLSGSRRAVLRNVLNRGPREGLEVNLLPAGGAREVMQQLRHVSDVWLATRGASEKGFSMGAFDPDYVAGGPVAVMRLRGEIVAFATLLATSCREEVQVDLMRHVQGIPNMAMEYLFLRLCQILKADGVRYFVLGMAPLAGLSDSEAAPSWQALGRVVYEHSARFYNFKGLRAFKAKFQPEWRSRYLAVAPGASPLLVLVDAAQLIGRRKKALPK